LLHRCNQKVFQVQKLFKTIFFLLNKKGFQNMLLKN
jgi:hypothetical protein